MSVFCGKIEIEIEVSMAPPPPSSSTLSPTSYVSKEKEKDSQSPNSCTTNTTNTGFEKKQRFSAPCMLKFHKGKDVDGSSNTTSSVSTVENSDDDDDDDEVQSGGGALGSMGSLEDSLPIKRGLSNFFNGKSKSFANLSEVVNFTASEIAKPENSFNKRKRILMANKFYSTTDLRSMPAMDDHDAKGYGVEMNKKTKIEKDSSPK